MCNWARTPSCLHQAPAAVAYTYPCLINPSRKQFPWTASAVVAGAEAIKGWMASQVAACVVDTAEASSSGREHATLDREAFKQILNLVALRVPARQCADMMKAFRG